MKKITIIAAMLLMVSTSAFAAGTTVTMALDSKENTGLTLYGADSTATASSATALIGKCSTGVGLSMATSEQGYALATQHMNGSKAFASSFDSTSIFSQDATTVGSVVLDVTTSDTSQFSSWKAL